MVVEMSTGMIRGLGTVVVFVAFVGLTLWVFNAKRSAQSDSIGVCRLTRAQEKGRLRAAAAGVNCLRATRRLTPSNLVWCADVLGARSLRSIRKDRVHIRVSAKCRIAARVRRRRRRDLLTPCVNRGHLLVTNPRL